MAIILIIVIPIHSKPEPLIPQKRSPKKNPISLITSHNIGNANASMSSVKNAIAMNLSMSPISVHFKSRCKIKTSLSHFLTQACFFIKKYQVRILKEEKRIASLNASESRSVLFGSRISYENDSTYFLAENSESGLYVISSLTNGSQM